MSVIDTIIGVSGLAALLLILYTFVMLAFEEAERKRTGERP